MRGIIGQVEEEGFVFLLQRILNEAAGVIRKGVRDIESLGRVHGLVHIGEAARGRGLEVVTGPGDDAEVFVKTALQGPTFLAMIAQMPFAGHERVVACPLEELGYRDTAIIEIALIRLVLQGTGHFGCLGHMTDAGLMRVQTGHETGSRGTAAC